MALDAREIGNLRRIIAISEKLIEVSKKPKRGRPKLALRDGNSVSTKKRIRRTGKDLIAFRRALKSEVKKGIPVSEIAKRHGISASYIYQL